MHLSSWSYGIFFLLPRPMNEMLVNCIFIWKLRTEVTTQHQRSAAVLSTLLTASVLGTEQLIVPLTKGLLSSG